MLQRNQTVYGLSLFLAPLLMFISSFFWVNGEYGVAGGTILILSTVFWIMALIYLFGLLKTRMPAIAQWGLLLAIFGFVSGGLFGFVGVLTEIFDLSHQTYIDAFAKYPVSTGLLLFWSGPLAPLSLILLGIFFLRTKTTKSWIAIMIIVGGLAFPASRISRNEWLAHVADITLLIPLCYLASQVLFAQRR
jgi:hypothetical protein